VKHEFSVTSEFCRACFGICAPEFETPDWNLRAEFCSQFNEITISHSEPSGRPFFAPGNENGLGVRLLETGCVVVICRAELSRFLDSVGQITNGKGNWPYMGRTAERGGARGILAGGTCCTWAGVCGRPPTNRPLLAVWEDGGVYSPSLRSRAVRLPPTPCRV